jgi:DNA-directed RNA polymerase specialized sigma24 family protein
MTQHESAAFAALTADQRRLVSDNIGLVAVHLRRRVFNLALPRREREREDLFQEGCLGLMEAARRWNPAGGIPFGAYALLRIRRAVARALQTGFAEPGSPPSRPRRRDPAGEDGGGGGERVRHDPGRPPRSFQLPRDAEARIPDRRNPVPPTGETIGDRLRSKLEEATRTAADAYLARRAAVPGMAEVVRTVVEERLLVPDEDRRRPVRRIARETGATFARVDNCERVLRSLIRSRLADDGEFVDLAAAAEADPATLREPYPPEGAIVIESPSTSP